MSVDTRVAKWGNCLAVRIPRTIAKEACLAEGDRVSLELDLNGNITLRSAMPKYELNQLVSGITSRNRHREAGWGRSVGKEAL